VGEQVNKKGEVRDVFEIIWKGKKQRVAVQVSENGYIVGANKVSNK